MPDPAFLSALKWLWDKTGGAVVGEYAKKHAPFLNKVDRAQKETVERLAALTREAGRHEAHIELLIEQIAFKDRQIEHLKGCLDLLETHCKNEGVPVTQVFFPPAPPSHSVAKSLQNRRAE